MKAYLTFLILLVSTQLLKAQVEVDIPEPVVEKTPAVNNFVEISPSFRGGEPALRNFLIGHLIYPAHAIKNKIGGRVFVQFSVEPDGTLTDITAIRSPSQDLSNEAIRVFSHSPRWMPGVQNGRMIRVKFIIPVTFDIASALANAAPETKKDADLDTTKKVFSDVDTAPEFVGGTKEFNKYVVKNLQFPQTPKNKKANGTVKFSFIVERDGSLTNVKINNGLTPDIDQEIIRIVSASPKWLPGLKHAIAVRTTYDLEVEFKHDNE